MKNKNEKSTLDYSMYGIGFLFYSCLILILVGPILYMVYEIDFSEASFLNQFEKNFQHVKQFPNSTLINHKKGFVKNTNSTYSCSYFVAEIRKAEGSQKEIEEFYSNTEISYLEPLRDPYSDYKENFLIYDLITSSGKFYEKYSYLPIGLSGLSDQDIKAALRSNEHFYLIYSVEFSSKMHGHPYYCSPITVWLSDLF